MIDPTQQSLGIHSSASASSNKTQSLSPTPDRQIESKPREQDLVELASSTTLSQVPPAHLTEEPSSNAESVDRVIAKAEKDSKVWEDIVRKHGGLPPPLKTKPGTGLDTTA